MKPLVDKQRYHDDLLLRDLPDDDCPALNDEEIEKRAAVIRRIEQQNKGNKNGLASLNRRPRHADIN